METRKIEKNRKKFQKGVDRRNGLGYTYNRKFREARKHEGRNSTEGSFSVKPGKPNPSDAGGGGEPTKLPNSPELWKQIERLEVAEAAIHQILISRGGT